MLPGASCSQTETSGSSSVPDRVRASVASEPGLAGVAAAFSLGGPTATPLGEFRLDSGTAFVALVGLAGAERRYDGSVGVPNDPGFVGLTLVLQRSGRRPAARCGSATRWW